MFYTYSQAKLKKLNYTNTNLEIYCDKLLASCLFV